MAIKAVIFDCFGVLLNQDGILKAIRAFPENKTDFINLFKSSDYGKISRQHFVNEFSKLTGISEKELSETILDFDDATLFDQVVIDWAVSIKAAGKCKVGMLSNVGHGWLDFFLKEMSKVDLFDCYLLSCDEGIAKPDPEIFMNMAKKIGLNPNECVMVDDRAENIAGAKSAGMQGIVFANIDQAKRELDQLLGE